MMDYVRVDTLAVADGSLNVLVIADPCSGTSGDFQPEQGAPDVKCSGGKLHGATFSAGGHPIIGVLFPVTGGEQDSETQGNCAERPRDANGCYQSGMGEIFRNVACKNGGNLNSGVQACDNCDREGTN